MQRGNKPSYGGSEQEWGRWMRRAGWKRRRVAGSLEASKEIDNGCVSHKLSPRQQH